MAPAANEDLIRVRARESTRLSRDIRNDGVALTKQRKMPQNWADFEVELERVVASEDHPVAVSISEYVRRHICDAWPGKVSMLARRASTATPQPGENPEIAPFLVVFLEYVVADIAGDQYLRDPDGLVKYVHVVFLAIPALPATLFCKVLTYRASRMPACVIFPLRCCDIITGPTQAAQEMVDNSMTYWPAASTPRIREFILNPFTNPPKDVDWISGAPI